VLIFLILMWNRVCDCPTPWGTNTMWTVTVLLTRISFPIPTSLVRLYCTCAAVLLYITVLSVTVLLHFTVVHRCTVSTVLYHTSVHNSTDVRHCTVFRCTGLDCILRYCTTLLCALLHCAVVNMCHSYRGCCTL
jgi:hypothetical protein